MTNLKLNSGDPNYQNCVLSIDNSNTTFTLSALCGDSTLSEFLRTGKPPLFFTMRPNPAQDGIQIEIVSAVKQNTMIEIYDALGLKKFSDTKNLSNGLNTIHLDTKGFSSGIYLVKIAGESRTLVISR